MISIKIFFCTKWFVCKVSNLQPFNPQWRSAANFSLILYLHVHDVCLVNQKGHKNLRYHHTSWISCAPLQYCFTEAISIMNVWEYVRGIHTKAACFEYTSNMECATIKLCQLRLHARGWRKKRNRFCKHSLSIKTQTLNYDAVTKKVTSRAMSTY